MKAIVDTKAARQLDLWAILDPEHPNAWRSEYESGGGWAWPGSICGKLLHYRAESGATRTELRLFTEEAGAKFGGEKVFSFETLPASQTGGFHRLAAALESIFGAARNEASTSGETSDEQYAALQRAESLAGAGSVDRAFAEVGLKVSRLL